MDYFLKHLEECSNEFTFRRVKEKVLIYLNDDPVNDITDSEKSKNDALLVRTHSRFIHYFLKYKCFERTLRNLVGFTQH